MSTADPLNAADFLEWSLSQPEEQRHELVLGLVLRGRPPTTAETCVVNDLAAALRTALRLSGADCELFASGAPLRVDGQSVYFPDLMVTGGGAMAAGGVAASTPLVVAEALSPVPRTLDALMRVAEFLRVPSVRHVVMADPVRRALIWHHKLPGGGVELRVAREGRITLDPPGLTLSVADCFLSVGVETGR